MDSLRITRLQIRLENMFYMKCQQISYAVRDKFYFSESLIFRDLALVQLNMLVCLIVCSASYHYLILSLFVIGFKGIGSVRQV
jgi:hypothetical protein